MRHHLSSCSVAFLLIVSQMLGPATSWALEERGVQVTGARRAVVSGLTGGELTVTSGGQSKSVQFSEAVEFGDALGTSSGTVAEVLVNRQALVTILGDSQVQLERDGANTIVHLTKGDVLVSVAGSRLGEGEAVIIATPATRVSTTGGIIRARVGGATRQANPDQPPFEARPHLVSFSPTAQIAAAPGSGESFAVLEGSMQATATTPGGGAVSVPSGQGVDSVGGKLGRPSALTTSSDRPAPVLAITPHGQTPSTGMELITKQQMDQVGALQQALFGGGEVEGEEGQTNSAQGAIISTLFGTSGTSNPNSFFGTGSAYGAALLAALNVQGAGAVDDASDAANRVLAAKTTSGQVRGGAGLLLFTERPNPTDAIIDFSTNNNRPGSGAIKSAFTVFKELLLVDGGEKQFASHGGLAPSSTLVARAIVDSTTIQYGGSITGNVALPLQWEGAKQFQGPIDEAAIQANSKVLLMQNINDSRPVLDNIVLPSSFDSPCDGGGSPRCYGSAQSALSDFSSKTPADPLGAIVYDGTNLPIVSYVDGSITARSAIGGELITLAGGVVLDKGTQVALGTTTSTSNYFQFKSGLSDENRQFSGALLSVLASQEGGFNNPAFLKIQDRVLGVMDGSQVNGSGNVALLAVLDSRLIGPTATVTGRQDGQIPPLFEIDSLPTLAQSKVTTVKSAVVVRATNVSFGALDGALLEASSPILAINYGSMTTTGHFADLSTNGKLALDAKALALVQINNGSLTVGGSLLYLNNAKANVTGALFSIGANSTLTINGALLYLKGNSLFTLTSPTLGVFGQNSQLKLNNNYCSTGCKTLAVGNGSLLVAGGGTVELPASGFSAFLSVDGKAVNSDNSLRVQLAPSAAHFYVEPGSTLRIVAK